MVKPNFQTLLAATQKTENVIPFARYCFVTLLIFGGLSFSELPAQVSQKGLPESFQLAEKAAALIPNLRLTGPNKEELIAEDRSSGVDNRYGTVIRCRVDVKSAGMATVIRGKGTIWRYRIESEHALSLGLFFSVYQLPPGAKLFIYDPSRVHLRGAFTSFNNNAGRQLPVAEFPGNSLVIDYFEPNDAAFPGELVLGAVSQAYRDLTALSGGRIDINCEEGDDWQIVKHAVCLMTFHDFQSSYFCTGTLMNNVKEDETPYFLTANHCIDSEQEAATLVTYFNYENSACNSDDASFSQTIAGATFKAGSAHSDFSLLLLNELPPDEYNPYYAGWDVTGANPRSGACIHHPDGYAKCIALSNNTAFSYPEKIQWFSEDLRLISTTLPDTHWNVLFNAGLPEQGSSGAPMFDQNKRVAGQLHGGVNSVLLFGKLSLSWDYNPNYQHQLAYWLDPAYTQTRILDGIWKIPPRASFRAELQEVCVHSPVQFFDQSSHRPTSWLWQVDPPTVAFVNGTDSTSQNPEIAFLNDGVYSVKLRSTNRYGSDERVLSRYIMARSQLEVKIESGRRDTTICGCDLKNYRFSAAGAVRYRFSLDRPELIDTVTTENGILLTLNPYTNNKNSFDCQLKVLGTNGDCSATDSIRLHVIIQPNDQVADAANLFYGTNTGYSNRCATAQTNEPAPPSLGCTESNSWCPDLKQHASLIDHSVWFKFVAPESGTVSIGTTGFDDQIAVYEADSPQAILSGNRRNYSLVAANDNRSSFNKTALLENVKITPGKQYWLQVDGHSGAVGDLTIDLASSGLEALVFPNPSSGIYELNVFHPDRGNAELTVRDPGGRLLMEKRLEVSGSSTRFSLNLEKYPRGIYFLNVRMNGQSSVRKLIKL